MIYAPRADPVRVTLSGSENSTVFIGGVAEDTVRRIEGVIGGSGNNVLTGDGENNILCGMDGDDHLYGRGGSDELRGGKGQDYLDGGEGVDWAWYGDEFVPIRVQLERRLIRF